VDDRAQLDATMYPERIVTDDASGESEAVVPVLTAATGFMAGISSAAPRLRCNAMCRNMVGSVTAARVRAYRPLKGSGVRCTSRVRCRPGHRGLRRGHVRPRRSR